MPVNIVGNQYSGLDELAKAIPSAIDSYYAAIERSAKLKADQERKQKELAEYKLSATDKGFQTPVDYTTPLSRDTGAGIINNPVKGLEFDAQIFGNPNTTDEQKAQLLYRAHGAAPGSQPQSVPQYQSAPATGQQNAGADYFGLDKGFLNQGLLNKTNGLLGQDLPQPMASQPSGDKVANAPAGADPYGGWLKQVSNPGKEKQQKVKDATNEIDLRAKNLNLSQDLRKEYDNLPETKNYKVLKNAYTSLQASANRATAAGDMSMIFQYMKILDPNSTVREGEQLSAQQATSLPGEVVNAYEKARTGQRLNPNQRKDFVQSAGSLFENSRSSQSQVLDRYSGYAKQYGVSPDLVVSPNSVQPIKKDPNSLTGADKNAYDWAKKNPKDARAKDILSHLGL